MVTWWLPVDLLNILADIDYLETWLASIKRSFWGLSIAFKTMRIVKKLMEIWSNKVCNILFSSFHSAFPLLLDQLLLPGILLLVLSIYTSLVSQIGYFPLVCYKLHSVISPPFLRLFPWSQGQLKALKKTFWSMPVMSRGNQ